MKIKLPSGQIVSQAQIGLRMPRQVRTSFSPRRLRGLGQETVFNPPTQGEETIAVSIGGELKEFSSRPMIATDVPQAVDAISKYRETYQYFVNWRSAIRGLQSFLYVKWVDFVRKDLPEMRWMKQLTIEERNLILEKAQKIMPELNRIYEISAQSYTVALKDYETLDALVTKLEGELKIFGPHTELPRLAALGDPIAWYVILIILAISAAIIGASAAVIISANKGTNAAEALMAAAKLEAQTAKNYSDSMEKMRQDIEKLPAEQKALLYPEWVKAVVAKSKDDTQMSQYHKEVTQQAADAAKTIQETSMFPGLEDVLKSGTYLVLAGGAVFLAAKILPELLKKQPALRVAPQMADTWDDALGDVWDGI